MSHTRIRSRSIGLPLIVQARVKKMEDIPAHALCCEAQRKNYEHYQGTVWKLNMRKQRDGCFCMSCKARFQSKGISFFGMKGWYANPAAYDIDEGSQSVIENVQGM